MTTGLVFHERYLWHDTGHGWIVPNDGAVVQPFEHPENPETKRRMLNLWRASGLLDHLKPIAPRLCCKRSSRFLTLATSIGRQPMPKWRAWHSPKRLSSATCAEPTLRSERLSILN